MPKGNENKLLAIHIGNNFLLQVIFVQFNSIKVLATNLGNISCENCLLEGKKTIGLKCMY